MKTMIAPSILSADFSKMGEEIKRMELAGADIIHCDVMDGIFVPNITFGIKMVADIRKITSLPLDVHLMIVQPEKYVERFADAGADYITIHVEATEKLNETLSLIRKKACKCGAVISPDTPVSALSGCLELCDMALLMSVYPGFGGQKFIEKSLDRMKELSALAKIENPDVLLEIDGGVNLDNISAIKQAGAQIIVAGNTVFSATDPKAVMQELRAK